MRALLLTVTALLLSASLAPAVEKSAIDAAVDKGVAALKKMQRNDGTWPYEKIGATALAGLTLLECGAKADDRAVTAAADACRKVALTTIDTYSISLMILFLDRLDKADDTPLIEAMITNLLAGQTAAGGWDYNCAQAFTAEEIKGVADEASGDRELRGARELSKLPAKGKRVATELPKVVQAKLVIIARGGGNQQIRGAMGDNSNTQFATLALWAGRRYGVPTHAALAKIDARFRGTQNEDGSWGYIPPPRVEGSPAPKFAPSSFSSSAAMTCAGLLGLACGHGAKADVKKDKKDGKTTVDLSGDARVKAGLLALSTAVGSPVGWKGDDEAPKGILEAKSRAYYYLWSLERVCVILGLETLGKKDWYNWGAEILLKNQGADGAWLSGAHAESGADTCFALMFLKKTNLARDLSGSIKGAKDPGVRTLKSGGVGGGGLKGVKPLAPLDVNNKPEKDGKKSGKTTPKKEEKKPLSEEQKAAAKVSGELVGSKGKERAELLKKLRDSKGAEYTEALADVIPKLDAESRKLAREALADRLTKKTANTIRAYFKEDDPEIRRAAALAAGQKDAKVLIPDLIELLGDEEALVQRAARASLKEMAGKDLGDKPQPWREWWKKQAKE
jgi:hypothetical protein